MYGPHRTPQHVNGDFHWFLRTRFCRVVAQVVIMALVLLDAPLHLLKDALAQSATVFGPENFVRANGAPQTVTRTFNVTNPSGAATLCLANGGANNQYGRVSSAIVTLNNTQILRTNDFNQQVASLTRSVTLATANTLRVEVRSAPGSGFTLTIVRGSSTNCPGSTPINRAPTANAGPDQTQPVNSLVTLNGSGSSDPDSNPLTYQWSFVSKPASSTATLSTTAINPTFTIDKAGTYVLQLIVNDGQVNSAPDQVVISTSNTPPVANAGPDQSGRVTEIITLDGSGSSDVDGDPLTYLWSFVTRPAGSTATLSSTTAAVRPTFVLDKAGTYTVQLVVNDGTASSVADTVDISTINSPPVANAGPDQSGQVTTLITLDGSGSSDVDGNTLTYAWSLTAPTGSTATLSSTTAIRPTFTIDKPGTYTAQLIVNDGTVNSAPDIVVISTTNSKPVADASLDQTVNVNTLVTLDGRDSSDVDGDTLTYRWAISSAPAGSTATLSSTTVAQPTFTADKPGDYVIQLIVNDGTVDSDPDTVIISTTNSKPVADAGDDQTRPVNQVVQLDSGGSFDADNDPLTYTWALTIRPIGSAATLSDPTAQNPTFTPDVAGDYIAQLIVTDSHNLASEADTVLITVTPPVVTNNPPTITSTPVTTATVNQAYSYDVNATDPDAGDTLSYSLTTAPAGMTIDSGTGLIFWTPAANQTGSQDVVVQVSDGKTNGTVTQNFSITVSAATPNTPPTINSTPVTTAQVGQAYSYDVNATDPDAGDTLTYALATNPTGMMIDSGTGLIAWTPAANQTGAQNVTVQVSDGHPSGTATQSFTVQVIVVNPNNMAPRAQANSYTIRADQTLTVPAPGVLGNDSDDENDPITARKLTDPTRGALSFNTNGSFSFTPNADTQTCATPPPAAGISFTEPLGIESNFPNIIAAGVRGLAKGDFNQDGFLDLAVTGNPALAGAAWRIWLVLGNGDGTFQAPVVLQNFTTDLRPSGILAKDVDGDCKLDLFVAVELAKQVLFFKGRGDGTFDASVPTTLTQSPASLQSADVNGDSNLDLVTLNSFVSTENSVTVLLGNGNGTFQSPVNYPAGTQLSDMALGDVNGDNAPDIVVGSSLGSSNLSVLLNTNTGSGAFAAAQPFPVKMSVSSLYLADFNRDTKLDVVLGGALCEWTGPNPSGEPLSPVTGCMTFIPGAGDGTFSVPLSVPVNRSPFTTAMANRANRGQYSENVAPDVNGDGILDVVFGGGEVVGNLLHVRLGNGDGTFSTTAWVASPGAAVGVQPLSVLFPDGAGATGSVVIDDFTGDGVMDIATAHAGSNSPGRVALLPGTTPGKFAAPRIFPVLETPYTGGSFSGGNVLTTYPMTLGDFNNDGQPELAVLAAFNRVGLMPFAADGTLGPVQTGIFVGSSQPNAVKILSADFDRDGNLDVVWTSVGGLTVAYGNGAGQFTNPVFILPPTGAGFFNIALGDFNGDGFPDVAAYTGSSSVPLVINVYLSTGGGRTFTRVPGSALANFLVATNSVAMVVADFDHDGGLDMVLSLGSNLANQSFDVQRTLFLRGNGDGAFQPAVSIANGIQGGFVDYAAADVNHDDKLDLIGIAVFSAVHVQLGNGDGTFQAPVLYNAYTPGSFGTLGQVVLADFDWDGHLDVALTTPGTRLSVLRGLGDGTFTAAQKFAAGSHERTDSSLLVADVNIDGRPDLIVGGRSFYAQDFTVLLNNSATLGACIHRDSFTYTASDGSLDSPPVTVRITIQPVNHPPVIISAPVTNANTGQLYTYDVNAIDQDVGERLSYALVTAPSGMTIDPATGVIQWLPAANQAGANSVKVRVYDSSGVFAEQTFTLTVTQRVIVPNVVGQTQAAAQTTITGVGLTVGTITPRYSPTIPAGIIISQSPQAGVSVAQNSAVSFVVSLGPLVVPGLTSITVLPSNPVVLVSGTQAFTATGVLSGGGTVDVSEGVTWSSGTTTVATINSFGTATGVAAGNSVITATLGSVSGNTTLTVRARMTGDTTLPTAAIPTPADGAEVTSPINVIGTATDANFFRYELAYAVAGETNFTLLATGSSPVSNGVLGQFDPTLLINDLYDLKLTVFDLGGNEASAMVTVQVARELKVGLFTITFQDLNIPLSGIPITINRTYDSRDKGKGDFGIGWRLDIQTLRIRPNREQGSGWVANLTPGIGGTNIYSLAPVGQHKMSLTLPGGKVEEFDMVVNPAVSLLVPIQTTTASYIPRAGTLGSLISRSDNDLLVVGNQPGDVTLTTFNGDTYNPKLFTYITADGQMIDIDRTKGVEKVHDPNGNTLTFGLTGIIHSSGKSVTFTRDAQNRITQITDPNGNSQSYVYDVRGDLITHTDQTGNTTTFTYNSSHGLLQITDPLNRPVSRNEYDANGRLISVTDAKGNRISYNHDLNARQEVTTDRLGRVSVYSYDDQGNILTETNPLGETTTYTYDTRGNRLSETDPLGRTTTFTYDNRNNPTSVTDPLGHRTTFTYDSRGQILTSTDPEGHTGTNSYDASGNLVAQVGPLGNTTSLTYDGAGHALTITDSLGQIARNEYDVSGNRTRLIEVSGNALTFSYDANGNLLSQADATSAAWGFNYDPKNRPTQVGLSGAQKRVSYDAAGQMTTITDPAGQETRVVYDALGLRAQVLRADGIAALTRTYDAEGNVLTETDAARNTTSYTYNAANRRIATTFPDSSTEQISYDATGQPTQVTDALGHITRFEYDAAGRQIRIINPLGGVTEKTYSPSGHLLSERGPLRPLTRYAYDAGGNLVATTYADGSIEQRSYDASGRLTQTRDPAGNTTTFEYDAMGRMTAVTDALGRTARYEYSATGQRTAFIDANGNRTVFTNDAHGRVVQTQYPLGDTTSTTYDALGRTLTATKGNGETVQYTYDVLGQPNRLTLPGGSQETYTYTADGQIDTVTDARGVTRYTYDTATRRLARVTEPDGRYIRYEYDAVGNRTLIAHALSTSATEEVTRYAYDAARQLITVTDPSGGLIHYTYDAAGNQTVVSRPNGVTTTMTYDNRNRLTAEEHGNSSSTTLARFTYTLDVMGNRTVVQNADNSRVEYDYDATYRVTTERHFDTSNILTGTITYSYDAAGNLVSRTGALGNATYNYNANNQLTAGDGLTYAYDSAGNLLSTTEATNAVTSYTHDARGRLVRLQPPIGGATTYGYDHQGIRQSKSGPTGSVNFLIDRANPTGYEQVVRESNTSGTTLRSYVYGSHLLSQTQSGASSYYHGDALGSTRLLTNASGAPTDTYAYTAYGSPLAQTGSTPNAYQFVGEQQDAESNLYYLRARYYNPSVGRFLSRDPVTGKDHQPLSFHKYLYAHANPVNLTDPTGRAVPTSIAELISSLRIQFEANKIQIQRGLQVSKKAAELYANGSLRLAQFFTTLALTESIKDPGLFRNFFGNEPIVQTAAKVGLAFTEAEMFVRRAIFLPGPLCAAKPDSVAYVAPFQLIPTVATIFLCPSFFTKPPVPTPSFNPYSSMGALTHEFAHFTRIILGELYGCVPAFGLAKAADVVDARLGSAAGTLVGAGALLNADNYRCVVEGTALSAEAHLVGAAGP